MPSICTISFNNIQVNLNQINENENTCNGLISLVLGAGITGFWKYQRGNENVPGISPDKFRRSSDLIKFIDVLEL